MKVTKVEENLLVFDSGLKVEGTHSQDCCEHNFLDFEQFKVGDEFKDYNSVAEFMADMRIKEDGFILKDKQGIPKWVQARSYQNGYYSNTVGIRVSCGDESLETTDEVLSPNWED